MLDQRVEALESELKLLKAEIQTTLIDLRDVLARQEFPIAGKAERRAAEESGASAEAGASAPSRGHPREAPPSHLSEPSPAALMSSGAGASPPLAHINGVAPGPAFAAAGPVEPEARPGGANGLPPASAFAWAEPPSLAPSFDHPPDHTSARNHLRVPGPGATDSPPAANGRSHPAARPPSPASLAGARAPSTVPAGSAMPAGPASAARPVGGEAEPVAPVGARPDLRLLVGALKWAALAASQLGSDGPRQVIEMYHAVLPLPDSVRQVLMLAADQASASARADATPLADGYVLLLLSLHGLLQGGGPVGWGTEA